MQVNSYEAYGIYPHDWGVELRLVANSAQILSAFYDNPHGSYTIDISCNKIVPFEIWNQFSVSKESIECLYALNLQDDISICRVIWHLDSPDSILET